MANCTHGIRGRKVGSIPARCGIHPNRPVLAVEKMAADVIAAGSHSQHVVDRLIVGSLPAQWLRAAPHSVLIAAPVTVE